MFKPRTLIANNIKISGFYLGTRAKENGMFRNMMNLRQVSALMSSDLKISIQGRFPLSDVQEAVDTYLGNMSAGKVLLVPGQCVPGRPRVHLQVEHGVDARHAALHVEGHRCSARWQHNDITFSMLYAYTENFMLPFSHGRGRARQGVDDRQDAGRPVAEVREPARVVRLHVRPSREEAEFHGRRLGQTKEWNHDFSLDWHLLEYPEHRGLKQLVGDLNRLYRSEPSLHELDVRPEGFAWIDCNDHEGSVVSFVRRSSDPADFTVLIVNFTPVVRRPYRLGVPEAGHYREMINTDAEVYAGSNVRNQGGVDTEDIPTHGYEHSVSLVLPPLALPDSQTRTGEVRGAGRSGRVGAFRLEVTYARRTDPDRPAGAPAAVSAASCWKRPCAGGAALRGRGPCDYAHVTAFLKSLQSAVS